MAYDYIFEAISERYVIKFSLDPNNFQNAQDFLKFKVTSRIRKL